MGDEYTFQCTLPREQLDRFLADKEVSVRTSKNLSTGTLKLYYCKYYRRLSCPYRVKCIFSSVSAAVDVFTLKSHDRSVNNSAFFFHPELIALVEECVKLDLRPKHILERISTTPLPVPSSDQLRNLCQRVRKTVKCTGPVNQFEPEKFCLNRAPLSTSGDHDVAIPIFDVHPDRLHLCLTTRFLLNQAHYSPLLQCDATFKLNWHKYPCIVLGSQDLNRSFHPYSFHVVWKEEDTDVYTSVFDGFKAAFPKFGLSAYSPRYLMADGHGAITAAGESSFPDATHLMYWFHMKSNIKHRWSLLPTGLRPLVEQEIQDLQIAPTPAIFDTVSMLLVNEWRSRGLQDFADYFQSTWLQTSRGLWYEGAARLFPSTNNGLEGTNSDIKRSHTNRSQEPMSSFLPRIQNMVSAWSHRFEESGFANIPKPSISDFDKAWKWTQSAQEIHSLHNTNGPIAYAVKGSEGKHDLQPFLAIYNNPMLLPSFADYQTWLKEYHIVEGCPGNFFTCTCYSGLKLYRCKHSLGVEILKHGLHVPPQVSALPIGDNRKRARPKKAGPAMSRN